MGCAEFLSRWRKWIRPLVMALYTILVIIAIPLCIIELNSAGAGVSKQSWFVGGIFVMAAIPISLWGILQHLIHYTKPYLQRHIIRILWMVPIYAVNAWFGLRFPSAAIYLDTLRECYEAYVIYNFLSFLLNFLASQRLDYIEAISAKQQQRHLFPFCKLPPWKMGKQLINRCRHGALQYTVIRPVTTLVALICQLAGQYVEGEFSFYSSWLYLVIINNLSQIYAMYCLVLFYKACKEELAPLKPVSKFLCVKFVIFMSFWQAVAIAALVQLGVISKERTWGFEDVDSVAISLQDFCICIEMFIAAIAHFFSFSHIPYVRSAEDANVNCCRSFLSMFDMTDMRDDVVDHVRAVGERVQRPFRRRAAPAGDEHSPLLSEQADVHGTTTAAVAGRIRSLSSGSIGTATSLNADVPTEPKLVSESLRNQLPADPSSLNTTADADSTDVTYNLKQSTSESQLLNKPDENLLV